MILYQHPLSPYAQKIRIALREKGSSFEAKPLPMTGADGPAALVNPRIELPALNDGGVVIFDSTIILEYLEDRFPDPPLLPSGAAERAKVRMIEEVCDTHYEAINWGAGRTALLRARVWRARREASSARGGTDPRPPLLAGKLAGRSKLAERSAVWLA